MKDALIYFSIFWAVAFICMGIYLRYKYKDRLDELDQ
jgi:hypothetical protein